MRRTVRIGFARGNWWFWLRHRNPIRVFFNVLACGLSMLCPVPEIKNPLLRLTGMKVGKNAFIAAGVALDVFYPELLEIGDNAIIGYGCVITAHEMVQGELRIGRVAIGPNSVVGARCVVLPGTKIGSGAVVSAMSLVNCDIAPNGFYGGVPARKLGEAE